MHNEHQKQIIVACLLLSLLPGGLLPPCEYLDLKVILGFFKTRNKGKKMVEDRRRRSSTRDVLEMEIE